MKSHDEKSIKCSACTRYFASEEDKQAHVIAKHSRVYMCDVCGKTFKRQSGCNEHMKNMHSTTNSQTLYECPYESCHKHFTRKTLYQDHLNKHSKTQPYSCDKCSKAFYSRYAKSAHEKVCGSDEHPYKCSECDMSFLYQSSLNHHTKGVHGQAVFTCACGAHYKYETGLFRHKKKHKH
jgi:KRAB domain-containing zinc finger protein